MQGKTFRQDVDDSKVAPSKTLCRGGTETMISVCMCIVLKIFPSVFISRFKVKVEIIGVKKKKTQDSWEKNAFLAVSDFNFFKENHQG